MTYRQYQIVKREPKEHERRGNGSNKSCGRRDDGGSSGRGYGGRRNWGVTKDGRGGRAFEDDDEKKTVR